jgi:hypothetical protein
VQEAGSGRTVRGLVEQRLEVVAGHRDDVVGVVEDIGGQLAAGMLMQCASPGADDLDGVSGGGHAVRRGDPGRNDDVASFFKLVGGATEPLRKHDLAERFGHRTAAGVARADEEDDRSRHARERGAIDHSGTDDAPTVFLDAHGRGHAFQERGTVVDHHRNAFEPVERFGGCGHLAVSPHGPGENERDRQEPEDLAHEGVRRRAEGHRTIGKE